MAKPVAVDGDTQFKTSTNNHPSDINKTGAWSLVTSNATKGQRVSVNGKFVELVATASWTYTGGTTQPPPPATTPVPVGPFPDSAILNAGNTVLEDSGSHILVDGDKASGTTDGDNQIVVSASQQKLQTDWQAGSGSPRSGGAVLRSAVDFAARASGKARSEGT
jgi:hypothetical protein